MLFEIYSGVFSIDNKTHAGKTFRITLLVALGGLPENFEEIFHPDVERLQW